MHARHRNMAPFIITASLILSTSALARPTATQSGMAVSAHPLASQAGAEILRAGGNAADAAAAVALALAVVEPYSSGLGGGGFALVRMGEELTFMDFRETAPKAAERDMYIEEGVPNPLSSRDGIRSVAVPGAAAGYLELQQRYGKLERARVLAPAIALARDGFRVTTRYQDYVAWRLELLRGDPEICKIFLVKDPDGQWVSPELGHRIVQPDLTQTLIQLADQGTNAFYAGDIAKKLAADMQARQGLVTADDLASYRVRYREPLTGTYRGHTIVSSPPPSSGGQILLTLLNILETQPAPADWRDPEFVHLYIEASKRAFADRALLGDPDFLPYLPKLLGYLTAKDRAALLSQVINETATDSRTIPAAQGSALPADVPRQGPAPFSPGTDTSHLSVIDSEGNAVAMTTTINYAWGSGVVARGTGIIWNDEMDDFAVAPGVPNAYGIVGSDANAVEPGKVPLSSMSPTMMFLGDTSGPLELIVGSPGGSRIPTTVAQAIINIVDFGADAENAINLGRIHHQHLPDTVFVEPYALESATRRALEAKGHVLKDRKPWSNATIIYIDPKTRIRYGAADRRGDGSAIAQ